jgi:hypothetical protein
MFFNYYFVVSYSIYANLMCAFPFQIYFPKLIVHLELRIMQVLLYVTKISDRNINLQIHVQYVEERCAHYIRENTTTWLRCHIGSELQWNVCRRHKCCARDVLRGGSASVSVLCACTLTFICQQQKGIIDLFCCMTPSVPSLHQTDCPRPSCIPFAMCTLSCKVCMLHV